MAKVLGYIHIYTGEGKGKTTAAVGLALRSAAANYKVLFVQFMKAKATGEIKELENHKNITTKQFGINKFCTNRFNPDYKQIKAAQEGIEYIKENINKFDVVILDEINVAIYFNLIKEEQVLEIIDNKPKNVELILTGRNMPESFLKKADLISEIVNVKHYFDDGVPARKGIEF